MIDSYLFEEPHIFQRRENTAASHDPPAEIEFCDRTVRELDF